VLGLNVKRFVPTIVAIYDAISIKRSAQPRTAHCNAPPLESKQNRLPQLELLIKLSKNII